MDAISGEIREPRYSVEVPGVLIANRDGRHAMVVGPQGALSVDTTRLDRVLLRYDQAARDVAPSWKHNILFVSTDRGVDLFYVGRSGGVPYTIPLDGPGGPLAMNRSGTRLYAVARGAGVIDVIDTEQYLVVERIRTAWEPVALVVAPDESALYVAAKEGVTAVDLATHLQRGATHFSGTPVDMGISPNGDQLYVALDGSERGIAVVSTTDLRRAHFVRVDASVQRLVVASY
jgi:DNA-binding beta-propeller fold protein YncE